MAKVNVYNLKGEIVAEENLKPSIFEVPIKSEVIEQALLAQMSNARNVIAHTKGRSEVRGGGKKPWKQKGTGRARHGSIRSPLWIGGGVTFGPTNLRNFSVKINKKAKKKALNMILSDKVNNNKLFIVEKLEIDEAKTKKMIEILKNFNKLFSDAKEAGRIKSNKILMVYANKAGSLIKAGKNIKKLKIIGANNLNIKDILDYEYIMMAKDGIKIVENLYKLNKKAEV